MELDQKPRMPWKQSICGFQSSLPCFHIYKIKQNIKHYPLKIIPSGTMYNHCPYLSTSFIYHHLFLQFLTFLIIFQLVSTFSSFKVILSCHDSTGFITQIQYYIHHVQLSLLKKDIRYYIISHFSILHFFSYFFLQSQIYQIYTWEQLLQIKETQELQQDVIPLKLSLWFFPFPAFLNGHFNNRVGTQLSKYNHAAVLEFPLHFLSLITIPISDLVLDDFIGQKWKGKIIKTKQRQHKTKTKNLTQMFPCISNSHFRQPV